MLPNVRPPPTARASGGALTHEGLPHDYQQIISIGAHDATELAAPFESETSQEVHARLGQLATQLKGAGMDEQESELATSIEWSMRDLIQACIRPTLVNIWPKLVNVGQSWPRWPKSADLPPEQHVFLLCLGSLPKRQLFLPKAHRTSLRNKNGGSG